MENIKFEIKKEHIALLKAIVWHPTDSKPHFIDESPFGLHEGLKGDLSIILNGKGILNEETKEVEYAYSDEELMTFYNELLTNLKLIIEIMVKNGELQCGVYRKRHYEDYWTKLD